jgi:hypothetical protein
MKRGLCAALLGLALLAGVSVAAPQDSSAASGCAELADAALYHIDHGNLDYAFTLVGWWYDNGCNN